MLIDMLPSIGVSTFARERHTPVSGKSFFDGPWEDLISLICDNWEKAVPGTGENNLTRKIVIPLPTDRFVGCTVTVQEDTVLQATMDRRQPHEEPFIKTVATGRLVEQGDDAWIEDLKPDPVISAKVVLYSKEALSENKEHRSTDCDWEIVALLVSSDPEEPMHPLTMARNFLELPGGTKSVYSAEQFAKAIVYWSRRCSVAV